MRFSTRPVFGRLLLAVFRRKESGQWVAAVCSFVCARPVGCGKRTRDYMQRQQVHTQVKWNDNESFMGCVGRKNVIGFGVVAISRLMGIRSRKKAAAARRRAVVVGFCIFGAVNIEFSLSSGCK